MVKVMKRFSVWLVSGYARVFILLCVVIDTLLSPTANVGITCAKAKKTITVSFFSYF